MFHYTNVNKLFENLELSTVSLVQERSEQINHATALFRRGLIEWKEEGTEGRRQANRQEPRAKLDGQSAASCSMTRRWSKGLCNSEQAPHPAILPSRRFMSLFCANGSEALPATLNSALLLFAFSI